MARAKPKTAPTQIPEAPKRLLRSKGPLGPAETEVVIFAGLQRGEIVSTPAEFEINTRSVINLITDRPDITGRISHKQAFNISSVEELRARMLDITFGRHNSALSDNQAVIAGSIDVINSALPDAYKIVLFVEGYDTTLPPMLEDWKATKPDSKTTPPTITLVRH